MFDDSAKEWISVSYAIHFCIGGMRLLINRGLSCIMYYMKKNQNYLGQKIAAYRESLNLSQKEFAKRLALPQTTISRIESGETGVSAKTLMKFLNAMQLDFKFVEATKYDGKEFTLTPIDAASHIVKSLSKKLGDDYDLTNMKLQKLLYYVQMFSIGITGNVFFQGDLYAWKHGPVSREMYYEFKTYESKVIPTDAEELVRLKPLSLSQEKVLEKVVNIFGTMSAYQLRNKSHNESPWRNASKKNGDGKIELEDLRTEYDVLSNLLLTTNM